MATCSRRTSVLRQLGLYMVSLGIEAYYLLLLDPDGHAAHPSSIELSPVQRNG